MKNDKVIPAEAQHKISQKSQRIYKHTLTQPIRQIAPLVRKVGRNMDIARSKSIAHFTPHNSTSVSKPVIAKKPETTKRQFDIAPKRHPLAAKVDKTIAAAKTPTVQAPVNNSSKAVKEQIIAEAFDKLSTQQKQENTVLSRKYKFINFFIFGIVLLIVIAYFIFINMPAISVNIASAQAGISATYPEYCPDGYSIDGPVTYSDSMVTIKFKANTGIKGFTITQSKSSWDSSAVKNKVNTDSKSNFSTTAENGLTIYTYDSVATWVNGGILYAISGNAPLSNSQIRHIATSL